MTKAIVSFIVGISFGAGIWWASPHLTGKTEPWDVDWPFYPVCLFVAGIITALICRWRFWISILGIYVGQFLYAAIFLPGGPLWIIGMIYGGIYLLFSLFGGLIVLILWSILSKSEPSEPVDQGQWPENRK